MSDGGDTGVFNTLFFNELRKRSRKERFELAPGMVRDYSFPTFYGDVINLGMVFGCSAKAAQALLPAGFGLVAQPAAPDRALMGFGFFLYRNVEGMGSYHEIAASVLASRAPTGDIPALNAATYVFDMPVTSHENMLRGRVIWGLPKRDMKITSAIDGDLVTFVCTDDKDVLAYRCQVGIPSPPTSSKSESDVLSVLDGSLRISKSWVSGDIAIGADTLCDLAFGPAAPACFADPALDLDAKPALVRFGAHVSSAFDLPHTSLSAV